MVETACYVCNSQSQPLLLCPYCNHVFCRKHRWDARTHHCPLGRFDRDEVSFGTYSPSNLEPARSNATQDPAQQVRTASRWSGKRVRIKWSYVFLPLWGILFAAGLLLASFINFGALALITFTDALILLVILYCASGIFRRGVARKVFAVLVILLLVGFVYQNPSDIAGAGPLKDLMSSQASYLTSLVSAATSSPSTVESVVSSVTIQSSRVGPGVTTTGPVAQSSTQSVVSQVVNPLIINEGANVTYPNDYQTVADYTLGLINNDRAINNLSPVTLSNVASAQQHADSMVYYDYFSHWDTQGYKPYMRYSLLGGTGAVAENIGQTACTNSPADATLLSVAPCILQTIENGINDSEWSMVYNDVGCCDNGHRDNILDPLHNQVSIGIAYNSSTSVLYFVEDFQNDYIALTGPIANPETQIAIVGSMTEPQDISTITVYYDALPQAMSASQLDSTSTYDPGTFVGGVFPPCSAGCEYYSGAVTVYASSWRVTATSVSIGFSLSNFVQADGPGVYTMYVQTGSSTGDSILTYSVFVTS